MTEPDEQSDSSKPSKKEVAETLLSLVLKDPAFRDAIGKRTTAFIALWIALGVTELFVGIPFLTLKMTPLAAAIIVFLMASVEDWIKSGKPNVVFYLCPNEKKYVAINWSSLPRYRKIRACPDCGAAYVTRCQKGRHFIVSSDLNSANPVPPRIDSFCSRCDPSMPSALRRYLPPQYANPTDDRAT